MQTTAIGTVANSLPQNEVILLTLLISKRYILFAELSIIFDNLDSCHANLQYAFFYAVKDGQWHHEVWPFARQYVVFYKRFVWRNCLKRY